jgi:hypothetical protein
MASRMARYTTHDRMVAEASADWLGRHGTK